MFRVSEDMITGAIKNGRVTPCERLDELVVGLPEEKGELSPEEKTRMEATLGEYVKAFGKKGLKEYIYSRGR